MATGFNNTPPASEFHRHSSWGRTRRPKNVNGASSTTVASPATAYSTENQRFLHVQCCGTATVTLIEVYYHGSGKWSKLQMNDGSGGLSDAAVGAGDTAIFEIAGADKVRFTQGVGDTAGTNSVWLLHSTF